MGYREVYADWQADPEAFWMQAAEMWQKSWEQGMKAWMDQANNMSGRK